MRGFRNDFDVLRNKNVDEEIVRLFMNEGPKDNKQLETRMFIEMMIPCKESDGESPIFKATRRTTDVIKGL